MELEHHLTFGPFCLDTVHGRVWQGERVTTLRPRSLAMLRYLVEHPGRLVTKAEVRQHVWAGAHVTDSVLRASVQEIRRALGDAAAAPQYLETVGGRGYRFRAVDDLDVPSLSLPGPIVGRQREVDTLQGWFERAATGDRQLAFVSGEVGVGKTTVLDLWLTRLAAGSAVRIARGQCIEHYGEGEPYLPLLEALGHLSRQPEGRAILAVLRQWAPMWLTQLPGLVSETELERLQRQLHGTTRSRMLRELAEALEVLTADTPLVLVLEDLHWGDHSTLEVLAYVAQRQTPARLLVLGTYRPVEVVLQGHPLRGMVQELRGRGQAVELQLECLSARDVAAYMAGRLGGPVATSLALVVHARTDGNALFLVNIVEHVVRQGLVTRRAGEWTLRPEAEAAVISLPEGLQQLLLRRVEELKPEVRQMLEAASVVGEEFAVAAVAEGAQYPMEDMEAQCEALAAQQHFLADAGLTVWPDGTRTAVYRFQHALYHQVLYERLGTARRVQLHRRIGARLEAGYGARAGEIAAQLAVHFERGSETHQAVHYWQQAAENATRRKAYHEAVAALRKGLALLAMLPESRERTQRELALQLKLGELVMAVKGRASLEASEVYTRAHALCQQVGEPRQRFQALWGLIAVYNGLGHFHTAAALGRQLLDLAQCQHDAVLVQESHVRVGGNALYCGDFVTARAHLEQSLEVSAVPHSTSTLLAGRLHPRITSYAWLLRPLWALGYAEQAQWRCQEALTLAQQLEHTPSLALVEYFAAMLAQARRDAAATYARADALMAFAAEGLVHRVEQGRILLGWALAMQGDAAAGVQQIHQGLAYQDMAIKLGRPHRLSLLAEAYGQAGQPEAGLQVLAEALALVGETGERWWEAELHRLKGVLLLQRPQPDVSQAEACFQHALDVAHSQQAKALELRAALSLSRLWQQQGQRAAVYALLAPLYGWFTEGFDTADLQEAQARLGSGWQH
jgi:predicted ATPase/DNA-binding winged helix-turn-helix (wHTH) protein